MRTSLLLVLALALSLLSPAAGQADETAMGAFGKRYLDGLFAAKPHLASFMGDHRFDDRWPDLSAAGIQARVGVVHAQLAELLGLLQGPVSLDDKIDGQIMRDALQLEQLYLTEIKDYSWDPRLHDSFPPYDPREIVADRLAALAQIDMEGEPPGRKIERLKALAARLESLPVLLSQMRQQLKQPARVYTERAIADNEGRIQTVGKDIKAFIDSCSRPADSALRERAEAAQKKALGALREYQKFLKEDLLLRSTGDWRLGAVLLQKKYPLALQTDLTPDQVIPRAEAVVVSTRSELYQVARRLHGRLFPQQSPPAAQADAKEQGRVISAVKDALSKDHPRADDLVPAHGRSLLQMRSFIEAHHLLSIPPVDTLQVMPVPVFKRGVVGAEYLAPDVLDRSMAWRATYYVDPIDTGLPPAKIEGLLRQSNQYEIELTGMHEAYPGHHTQHFYSRKSFNPVRAVLWNGPMEEGWAVYATTLMVNNGWGGKGNDAYRFFDLLGTLVVAHNALLDAAMHSGKMTDAQALRLMVAEGFQEQAAAEKKLLRAKMDSTQLSQYFLGLVEIEDLERDARQKLQGQGKAFDQRAFNEAVIGHGSVAVRYLRRFVLPGG